MADKLYMYCHVAYTFGLPYLTTRISVLKSMQRINTVRTLGPTFRGFDIYGTDRPLLPYKLYTAIYFGVSFTEAPKYMFQLISLNIFLIVEMS
jgi:hypothetical protein